MADIARDLGVSVVTVSKALRDASDISAEMKQRVLRRAEELGFRPNLAARSLATRRTYAIGLVVPTLMQSFFAEIATGLARTLHPRGYTLALVNSERDPELEVEEIRQLLSRGVDGIVVATAQPPGSAELFAEVLRAGVALVLVDRRLPELENEVDFVGADNFQVGLMATRHLLEVGRRRIAHIGCQTLWVGIHREQGYRAALEEQGLQSPEGCIAYEHGTPIGGYTAARRLLETAQPLPDAVFCFNDPMASGAMQALLEAGLRIPQDIAVMGAGNMQYADILRVPLSTVDIHCREIGEVAGERLLELLESSGPHAARSFHTPLRLVARESTAPNAQPQAFSAGRAV